MAAAADGRTPVPAQCEALVDDQVFPVIAALDDDGVAGACLAHGLGDRPAGRHAQLGGLGRKAEREPETEHQPPGAAWTDYSRACGQYSHFSCGRPCRNSSTPMPFMSRNNPAPMSRFFMPT